MEKLIGGVTEALAPYSTLFFPVLLCFVLKVNPHLSKVLRTPYPNNKSIITVLEFPSGSSAITGRAERLLTMFAMQLFAMFAYETDDHLTKQSIPRTISKQASVQLAMLIPLSMHGLSMLTTV